MMTNFTVQNNNIISKDRIELGSKETWYRSRGLFRTQYKVTEPECIIKDAPFITEGTAIEFWNSGSDLPTISMGGKATLPNGETYLLKGYRDVGISTGHPPVLRPVFKQKWTCVNSLIEAIELWEKNGKFYQKEKSYTSIGDEINNQTLKEFDMSAVDYPYELIKYEFYEGYQRVNLWSTQKKIVMRDTKEYLLEN
jgi:hypothetical protein